MLKIFLNQQNVLNLFKLDILSIAAFKHKFHKEKHLLLFSLNISSGFLQGLQA